MLALYYFEVLVGEEKKSGYIRGVRGWKDAGNIVRQHFGENVKVEKLAPGRWPKQVEGQPRPLVIERIKKAKVEKKPINAYVKELFEGVEPEFRKQRREAYRARAQASYDYWMQKLTGEVAFPVKRENENDHQFNRRVNDFTARSQYVKLKDASLDSYQWRVAVANKDNFAPNFDRARKDADAEVDAVKAAFLRKFTDKLDSAVGARAGLTLTGSIRMTSGFVEGRLTADFENGDRFVLEMDVIINYRYDSHRGGQFGFYQYPARFKAVSLRGDVTNSTSEKWMKEHFAPVK